MARNQSYPQLMIFREKHGDSIFSVDSAEAAQRVAVAVIRERAGYGYYPVDVAELERELSKGVKSLIEECGFPKETAPRTVEALKAIQGSPEERVAKIFGVDPDDFRGYPASIRESALANLDKFESLLPRRIAPHADEINDAKNIQLILSSERAEELTTSYRGREHNLALWILDGRRDYEYEDYEFMQPRSAPTPEELEESRVS